MYGTLPIKMPALVRFERGKFKKTKETMVFGGPLILTDGMLYLLHGQIAVLQNKRLKQLQ